MRGPGPVVVYTSSRIAIFAVTLAVLYWVGMRQLLLLVVALLVSGLLSFVLLSRQRDAMSRAVVERGKSLRERMREATEAEDEADDEMRAAPAASAGEGGREKPAAAPPEGSDDSVRRAGSGQGEPDTDEDRER